jgi:hypothetical protein
VVAVGDNIHVEAYSGYVVVGAALVHRLTAATAAAVQKLARRLRARVFLWRAMATGSWRVLMLIRTPE